MPVELGTLDDERFGHRRLEDTGVAAFCTGIGDDPLRVGAEGEAVVTYLEEQGVVRVLSVERLVVFGEVPDLFVVIAFLVAGDRRVHVVKFKK